MDIMTPNFAVTPSLQPVFTRLREILASQTSGLRVVHDSTDRYRLEAPIGPATLQAWGGRVRTPMIPVAWVEVRKAYVSYHLMGISGNARVMDSLSPALRGRMQGTSCFNFKSVDEAIVRELAGVTIESVRGMKKAGYIE
jgi:hypothetical protein